MSFVAVAVAGAAVVGAVATNVASNRAAGAARSGAASAADASIRTTEMQLEEIRRQYDYQQQILLPQIQAQYNAQGAFSDLLGIGGPSPTSGQPGGQESPFQNRGNAISGRVGPVGYRGQGGGGSLRAGDFDINQGTTIDNETGQAVPQYPGRGSTRFQRGPGGEFIDPNLDPTRLQDVNTLGDTVRGNLQAGTGPEDDPYRNYINENQFAADTAGDDLRVQRADNVRMADGAAGTGVYGDEFQTSPGYSFAVEEMNRASDRVRSAGGNYGGRAVIEAQRRAAGVANQEYYNWAGGRERDLGRRAGAEAMDISRGDAALTGFENQRIADVGRGDAAYQDYLRRREGDAARLDAAAGQEDSLIAADRQRSDQAYYNYLSNVGRVAGFGGGPAATAVSASQQVSGAVAGAYGQQGSQLSSIYSGLGDDMANIEYQRGAGISNALVSGMENYTAYRGSNPTPTPPAPIPA